MEYNINEILVPTDFSETSQHAVNLGKLLADRFNAQLHVLHVADDPILIAPTTSASFRQQYEEQALTRLRTLFSPHELSRFRLELAVRNGSAKREILSFARACKADLIIIGTHGRSALANMLLGSVAEHILRKAPCPVLTICDTMHSHADEDEDEDEDA